MAAIVQLLASFSLIDYKHAGATLGFPKVYANADTAATVVVDLKLSVFKYEGPTITQLTRAYNGELVGPTIRVRPGQTLKIRVTNDLEPELCDTHGAENKIHSVNDTSLHTHGLHISGEGPADAALEPVPPGHTREYVYPIPEDHMGGTFWYHPHVHGAGAIQAGGGAFGLLIIEDDAAAMQLPEAVAEAEDVPMVLTHLDMPWLKKLATDWYTTKTCLALNPSCSSAQCEEPIWGRGPLRGESAGDVLLINGMTRPTIKMSANRWYRWRMLMGSGGGPDFMPFIEGHCEIGLLAKDGILLRKAPRPIERGFMAGGNRADWLVRCQAGTHQFQSTVRVAQGMDDEGDPNEVWPLATIEAADEGDAPVDIAIFEPRFPCYLVNLLDAPTPARNLDFDMRSMLYINGHSWVNEDTFEHPDLDVGSIVDYTVYGLGYNNYVAHIFHVHVNSFQLLDDPLDTFGGYFQKGDWHDTLKGPKAWEADTPIRLRTQIDRFTGKIIVHCHFLWHQDYGMMAMLNVKGKEGTRYAGAKALDSTCYTSGGAPSSSLAFVAFPSSRLFPVAVLLAATVAVAAGGRAFATQVRPAAVTRLGALI